MSERDRIEYLMNLYELTPSQFSDKTGIQRASVSHILSNRNKPSLEILLKIYHTFPDVELAWLVAGEGNPPVINKENGDIKDVNGVNSVVETPQTANMLFSFMEENERSQGGIAKNCVKMDESRSDVAVKTIEKECVVQDVSDCVDKRAAALSFDMDSGKKIKEIKVFYNNGTYETFIPEK